MSGQIFISFSREHDAGYVGRLAGHLAARGVAAHYDSQPMSENWWETYTRAQVDACDALLLVMTPEAAKSPWVAREVQRATGRGKPIHALLLRGESFLPDVDHEDVRHGGMPSPHFPAPLQPGDEAADERALVPVVGGALGRSVGLETMGGVFTALLDRGTRVPCARTETFTTAEDRQEAIQVRVFQGDGPRVVEEQRIGNYEVRLLEAQPRGVPAIRVTFQVEATGAFRLTAQDGAGRDVPVAKLG